MGVKRIYQEYHVCVWPGLSHQVQICFLGLSRKPLEQNKVWSCGQATRGCFWPF